uniref:Uncharacterized protein n=1 Tax=Oryza punctata TaxID=4537 RepID=A0A0E0MHC5_ORYPU
MAYVQLHALSCELHLRRAATSDDDDLGGHGHGGFAAGKEEAMPSWRDQLTARALAASLLLSVALGVMAVRLTVTVGIVPSVNLSASLLGFFLLRLWTAAAVGRQPFTRQENAVVQATVASAVAVAVNGGLGSYLLAMNDAVAKLSTEVDGGGVMSTNNPRLGWMISFLFLVSFAGLFVLLPFRKVMIVDYKLTYPTGTATAYLINDLHTPKSDKAAKKQVSALRKYFTLSFLWGLFKWFYSAGVGCGFQNYPIFGLEAYKNRFYFDFSPTFIGAGMVCPRIVSVSALLGGIISWGVMWPLIRKKEGVWYPASLPETSLHGLQAYRVFIPIALVAGDGLCNLLKAVLRAMSKRSSCTIPVSDGAEPESVGDVDERRAELFLKDRIPGTVACAGYVVVAAVSAGLLPLRWYHGIAVYALAPVLAFCDAYATGMTDWSLASAYGKIAVLAVGAWAAGGGGGALAGLAACGVVTSVVATGSDVMQDFRTGYVTSTSPRSMFVGKGIGAAVGCVVAPCVFWLFRFDAVHPVTPYAATMYRDMAALGGGGGGHGLGSSLPKHCPALCAAFFAAAVVMNIARDLLPPRTAARLVPIPTAMAVPFYVGPYFAVDMIIGSAAVLAWEAADKDGAGACAAAVASGLICGDGIWTLPECVLAIAGVKPPMCIKFLSRSVNARVDAFITNQA